MLHVSSPDMTMKAAASAVLDVLPDGNAICHGDFHPGDIIMTAGGPFARVQKLLSAA